MNTHEGSRPIDRAPSPVPRRWPTERPELLPFLPLVYVAWSDGVLTDAEREHIRGRASQQQWPDEEAKELLEEWLDPETPPDPPSLQRLKTLIQDLAADAGAETRRSLVSLGLEMARTRGAGRGWDEPSAVAALEELEAALGVVGGEATREILRGREGPPAPAAEPETRTFDPEPLREYLDQPHGALRRQVLQLLEDPCFRFPHDLDVETYRARVMEALRMVAGRGWGASAYPATLGGGDDPAKAVTVFESLAFGDTSLLVKYGVQFGLFGGSILQLGTEQHHARYLPAVARLELPGCYAMTEIGHGSNVRDLETVARYDAQAGSFILDTPHPGARKDWIGGAARHARMATVFAQLEVESEPYGVHAFLVPIRDQAGDTLPGICIEDCGVKEGLNGVDNGRIEFHRVRVPRENLLNRFGDVDESGRYTSPVPGADRRFFTMLGTLVAGRISVAAAAVSAAKTGLTIAVRHTARRRQFGPAGGAEVPLLGYLAQQRLLLRPLATTYALHFAVRELVADYAAALTPTADARAARQVETRAAALKALASQHCVRTLQACREGCGGQGYLAANRLGRLRADTDVFTTFEGANAVLLQLVAKALLSEYREEMGDMRIWDLVRHVAERAQIRLAEANPLMARRTDEAHLRDPEFQAAAFRYREDRLRASLARRLTSLIHGGMDSFEAINLCQDHLLTLARAHGERLTVEAFHRAVAQAPTPGTSAMLVTLSDLHAASLLEQDRGWFLESGYFESSKSRAVRALVNQLCREVARSASSLVDAFGIPDAVLEAPIAQEIRP